MKRRLLPLLAILAALVLTQPATAADKRSKPQRLTVVELYTSQGCSSCPPADAFMGELVKRDGVLGLSVHVDYWDYIGWKDPFAHPAHTRRQRGYANLFNQKYVYTPQMVIHGAYQVTGSDKGSINRYLKKASKLPNIPVTLTGGPGNVTLELDETKVPSDVYVFSVFFDRKHVTKIKRGENGGRELAYYNVVRDFNRIGVWRGEKASMPVPSSHDGSFDACAVLLQSSTTGRIVGAAVLPLDGRS